MSRVRAGDILLPLGAAALLIFLWDVTVRWLEVPTYLVPRPGLVLDALNRGLIGGFLWPHIWTTVSEILSGYLLGCTAAFTAAVLVTEFRLLDRALYPLVVALQSVPKVALAPLIIVWFGFDLQSKVIMVALICFFPTFVSTAVGLKSYNQDLVDLYRAFGAGRRQILLSVKLPSATSSIFAGLEIGMVMALHGAVIAEFIAARSGLGHTIEAARVNFDVALMFAAVVVLACIGVSGNQLIKFIHRRVAFWDTKKTEAYV